MSANKRWTGEPDRCRCRAAVVATLEETLSCPGRWRYLPAVDAWVHEFP